MKEMWEVTFKDIHLCMSINLSHVLHEKKTLQETKLRALDMLESENDGYGHRL